jgi:hypothetical protein
MLSLRLRSLRPQPRPAKMVLPGSCLIPRPTNRRFPRRPREPAQPRRRRRPQPGRRPSKRCRRLSRMLRRQRGRRASGLRRRPRLPWTQRPRRLPSPKCLTSTGPPTCRPSRWSQKRMRRNRWPCKRQRLPSKHLRSRHRWRCRRRRLPSNHRASRHRWRCRRHRLPSNHRVTQPTVGMGSRNRSPMARRALTSAINQTPSTTLSAASNKARTRPLMMRLAPRVMSRPAVVGAGAGAVDVGAAAMNQTRKNLTVQTTWNCRQARRSS